MIKKIVFFTIVFFIISILILTFLNKKPYANSIISYKGDILSNNNVIIHNTFSGQYQNNKEYNIFHDIHIKQNQDDIMNIFLYQINKNGSQNIVLEDYSILTGKGNHRLTIFEQEFLKNNKHKTLYGIENLSGIEYQSNYKKGLFVDIFSLQGSYTNQVNQKNYYTINLKIHCGLNQYITKKQKCDIDGEIGLDLPINTYTKNLYIQGILYKEPII